MSEAAFDIAAGGMAAERSAMDVIARNLAGGMRASRADGESTVGDAAFVPASFSSALEDALSSADIEMPFANDMQWASAGAHPDFGAGDAAPQSSPATRDDGDPIGQMIALVAAGRAYDADVAALQAAKQMDVEASDIDKF